MILHGSLRTLRSKLKLVSKPIQTVKLKTIAIAATLLIVKGKLSETDSLHLKFGILKTRNLTSGGMLLNVLLGCRPLAALRLSGPYYKLLSSHEIANMINVKFLEPMQTYQSIDPPPPFESIPDLSQISVEAVSSILKKLPHKAPGPDGIPNWILKEYALILSDPICHIIRCSLTDQCLPSSWKLANIIPVSKQSHVQDVYNHLNPISLNDEKEIKIIDFKQLFSL